MRRATGQSILDEPAGGADGRALGRERILQDRLDEISASIRTEREEAARAEWVAQASGTEASAAGAGPHAGGPSSADEEIGKPRSPQHPRRCPRCGNVMQRTATLCGHCWLKVAPMGPDGVEPQPLPERRPWWRLFG